MADTPEKIEIIGEDGKVHWVDVKAADLFFHGSDGRPLTDEEWDQQKARLNADNMHLVPPEFR
jgi:hypothetical protein